MKRTTMPLLSAKLKIPKPRDRYIVRERLNQKLHTMKEYKVTVIKGGAGSGKTTLLSAFLKQENDMDATWLSVDETMNQAFVFWRYLFEAVRKKTGEKEQDLAAVFEGNMQQDMLLQTISLLLNSLEETKECLLVLDDFWYLSDEFLISTLDYFIGNLPDTIHLVLLTRQMPEVYLGGLSFAGEVLLIDEEELGFLEEEAKEFLEKTLQVSCKEDAAKEMIQSSGGWIGGLQLMAIAKGEKRMLPRGMAGAKEQLMEEYITREIFSYLTEEEKEFLIKTALLPYFTETFVKRYLPEVSFDEIIYKIMDKNLFVIQVEEEGGVFRYHSIMKEYLNHRLDGMDKEKQMLCNKAATIYHDLGDYEECVQELMLIKNYDRVMEELLQMPQDSVTFSYMMKVPLEEIRKNIDFAYQYFFCFYASLDVNYCEKIYRYLMGHIKEEVHQRMFQNLNLFWLPDREQQRVVSVSQELIDQMPLSDVSKAYLLVKEAYFLYLKEQSEEAYKYLDQAERIYKQTGNEYIEMFVLAERAQLYENNGELLNALQEYEKMKERLTKVPTLKSAYYIGIAGVHIKQLEVAKAKEELALAHASMNQAIESMYNAYLFTLAQYLYIVGEEDQAEEIIETLSKDEIYQATFFQAALLEYPRYRRKHESQEEAFIKAFEEEHSAAGNMDVELMYLKLIKERKQKLLNPLLEDLLKRARKCGNKRMIVEADLMKLHYLYKNDINDERCDDIFMEAVTYGAKEKMRLSFWEESLVIQKMVKGREESLNAGLTKEQLLFLTEAAQYNSAKGTARKEESTKSSRYELTERETEVLHELKKGGTNKQIAKELSISVATVKTHIMNIYSKLGVNNRIEAVNRIRNEEEYDDYESSTF